MLKLSPLKTRLNSAKSKFLNNNLIDLKNVLPIDFHRKPRGVDELPRWKATEFRTFLLYLGPVVLKNIINEKCYLNCMYLHFGKKLLHYLISNFIFIYGREWVSHNVHALQHLSDDYSRFGSLDN
ncbi:hypothetical protein ACI65C_013689 [Semiaphis heraclei]